MIVYAFRNATLHMWWCQGHLAYAPCKPYLWWDRKKAEKRMKIMDEFYGWTANGYTVEIVEFKLEEIT